MAQTNFTPILTYKSDTATSVPSASNLTNSTNGAELAVNTADKRLFTKDSGGNVVEVGTNPSSLTMPNGTANGVVYANGSKVLTSGSALTFDGTTSLSLKQATGGTGNYSELVLDIANSFSGTGKSYLRNISLNGGNSSTALAFGVNADGGGSPAEGMRLTSTGLGIGTSSPSTKLQVTTGATGVQALFTHTSGTPTIAIGNSTTTYNTQIGYSVSGEYGYIQAVAAAGVYDDIAINPNGGNVGIGTSSPSYKLEVYDATNPRLSLNTGASGNSELRFSTPSSGYQGLITYSAASNFMAFYTSATERMRLDSSGNLGLGVTPVGWAGGVLCLQGDSAITFQGANGLITANAYYSGGWKYTTTAAASYYYQIGGAHQWTTAASGTAGNAISFTQALTLDASGNLLIGTTSASIGNTTGSRFITNGKTLQITSDDGTNPRLITNNVGFGDIVASFRYTSVEKGSISITSTAVAFNTSSDYRLKNITGPITTSGAYIDSLNPVEGTWKVDGSTFVGLIAHEVQEASRTTIATGTKDGAEMQGMDYSSAELIANLIAEVKSLRQRVATLEAK